MLKAKDLKKYAREALSGRWLKAGVVGLVASLFGGMIRTASFAGSSAGSTDTENSLAENAAVFMEANPTIVAIVLGIALVLLIWALVMLVIGGATTLGYAKYNLNLVDDHHPKMGDLFSQYNRLGTGFGMQFFRGLFIFLWTLLLVIPGIMASYSYSMTPFILCENPEMTAREAIAESKRLMKGNKWRLFCLDFSFLGLYILCSVVLCVAMAVATIPMMIAGSGADTAAALFTGVIVSVVVVIIFSIAVTLVLMPYVTASLAVFYREISEGRYSSPQTEVEVTDYVYETVSDDEIEYIQY